jgi:hypothetical protein
MRALFIVLAALLVVQERRTAFADDPFAFFQPTAVLNDDARHRLDRGDVLVEALPAGNGELAILAAVHVNADGSRLAAWVSAVAQMLRSPLVPAIARFSDPPGLGDLDSLVLDDDDLNAIRRCRPGDCGLRLSDAEITILHDSTEAASGNWRAAAQNTGSASSPPSRYARTRSRTTCRNVICGGPGTAG